MARAPNARQPKPPRPVKDPSPRGPDGLTDGQAQAIQALLSCPSIQEAARVSGIPISQIYRWFLERNFREQLYRYRQEAFGHFLGRAKASACEALEVFMQALKDRDVKVRIAAAKEISLIAMRAFELIELDSRVTALEKPTIDVIEAD